MTLFLSLGVAVLFGTGAYLLLKQDLIRVVAGMVLISNAANLFIMSARLSDGSEPIYPIKPGESISDPLVQAMTLTAVVISFGVAALLLSIVYRVYLSHKTVDIESLSDEEERISEAEEQEFPLTPISSPGEE